MDAKLLAARAEIETVLRRYDVAGWVILHNAPGELEWFSHLSPSYSRIVMEPRPDGGSSMRMRAKPADSSPGAIEEERRAVQATANMMHMMALALGDAAMQMLPAAEKINKATGAKHTDVEIERPRH